MASIGLMGMLPLLGVAAGAALAAGQSAGARHPVFDYGIDRAKAAEYEAAVARVMAMGEEEMLSFLPETPYARFCECPNCFGGVQGDGVLRWTIDRPEELKCRLCGTVVLPNPRYPEDQVMEGKNKLGETIRFRFYLHPEKKTRHFFTTTALMSRRAWLLGQCRLLGIAYQATGKEEYARRVALVLDKIARVYPHYPVIVNGNGRHRDFLFADSQEPPFRWDGGRWGWHYPADEVPLDVLPLYDLVCDSTALDKLSAERGYDVRARVAQDFFRATVADVQVAKSHISNYVAYLGTIAALGRVIGEPGWVHWATRWIQANLHAGCFYDGCWHESPSYHYMTMSGIRSCFGRVRGYSDPPGYVPPEGAARLENLDPEKAFPFFAKALHAFEALDFPNGCSTPVHDTWAGERRSEPREKTVSTLSPGFGHASLGRGEGAHQMQAQLHFSGDYGHHHRDSLNLTLFAKGREMLSDIGYTWTRLRGWTTSTVAHNTVVVDRRDQGGRDASGDLLSFFPDTAGVSVVEADGRRAYAGVERLDVYRRLLVIVPVSAEDAYVVDLFRVRGGATHDWMLHGDADEEMAAACRPAPTTPVATMLAEGETWVEPQLSHQSMNPHGVLREMRSTRTDGTVEVSFTYASDPARGVQTHVLGSAGTEVFLGKSPSVRRAGRGSGGDNRKVFDYWMPQLLLRRTGEAPLASLFAAVHEAHAGKPLLAGVAPVALTPADGGSVALQVRHGDTVDTVISTLDAPPYPERATADGVRLRGRLGIVRRQGGRVVGAWLFDGQSLTAEGLNLEAERGHWAGEILGATRKSEGGAEDAFLTTAALPEGTGLRGVWMVVAHGGGVRHAYRIERVERRDEKTAIILSDDHGLAIEGDTTREAYFPQRTFQGPNTFVVPLAVATGRPALGR